MNVSSGTTAVATSGASAVTLIAASALKGTERNFSITNEGGVAGFYSITGGVNDTDWHRIPFDQVVTTRYAVGPIKSILFKRADSTDCTGLFASAW